MPETTPNLDAIKTRVDRLNAAAMDERRSVALRQAGKLCAPEQGVDYLLEVAAKIERYLSGDLSQAREFAAYMRGRCEVLNEIDKFNGLPRNPAAS